MVGINYAGTIIDILPMIDTAGDRGLSFHEKKIHIWWQALDGSS